MKNVWKKGEAPAVPELKGKAFRVEKADQKFWCYFDGFRSPSEESDLSKTLQWIIQQTLFGHVRSVKDQNGETVSLSFGKEAARASENEETAAEEAGAQMLSLGIVGALATARESGSSDTTIDFEERCWDMATGDTHWRLQLHYGRVLAEMLGRVKKKLPELDLFPLFDADPAVRQCVAEATKCYLLKLERASIALCRASLEQSLSSALTPQMEDEVTELQRQSKNGRLKCLITVCHNHGILEGLRNDADLVRTAGNDILHEASLPAQAKDVLTKTRRLIGVIEKNRRM